MTDTDDQPSIAELQRSREPDEDTVCRRCHSLVRIPLGMEPSEVCDACAQSLLPVLLEIAAAALAWRGPPGGGRSDAEIIGTAEVLIETLEKVRP